MKTDSLLRVLIVQKFENLIGLYCHRVGKLRMIDSLADMTSADFANIPKHRVHAVCKISKRHWSKY
jgi:hypothetical protein